MAAKHSTTAAVDDRRAHLRVSGPFEGWRIGLLDTPIRIFDLSRGGCFVNATHSQKGGEMITLKIELPDHGWIRVKAETLQRKQGGFAVRFVEMSESDARRLNRAIDGLASSDIR